MLADFILFLLLRWLLLLSWADQSVFTLRSRPSTSSIIFWQTAELSSNSSPRWLQSLEPGSAPTLSEVLHRLKVASSVSNSGGRLLFCSAASWHRPDTFDSGDVKLSCERLDTLLSDVPCLFADLGAEAVVARELFDLA